MGNARSLAGGVLLITPLTGADGQVYGLAQGPLQAGGIEAAAYGSSFQKNQPTSGRVPAGATIERSVAPSMEKETLTFGLKRPDFTTANNLVEAINKALGEEAAKAADPAQVVIKVPAAFKGKAVALVTKRIPQLDCDGVKVDTVGLPNHWGFVGLTKPGYLVNTLTPFVGDANTQTPEYKSFTVNIEKA
jgi:flagellar basal body P-ring protein FlgI